MESRFVMAGPVYILIIIHNRGIFVTYIFRTVEGSYIHRLQVGFIIVFIVPVGFSYFTTLNVMYLRRSVHDIVALKCCSKWAANESEFFLFLIGRRRSEK